MQNPSDLYHFETDTDPQQLRASVMLVALGGFMDAGHTQRLLTDHLLASGESSVVASFDADQLIDYRSRRPPMVTSSSTKVRTAGSAWSDRSRFTPARCPGTLP